MLDIKGVEAFKAKLKAVMPTVEAEVNTKFRKLGQLIFTDLVMNSPQWSGNLATNWHINTGGYNQHPLYEPWNPDLSKAYWRGQNPAVGDTLNAELPKLDATTYRDTIRLYNSAPYAPMVEVNVGPEGKGIRKVNKLAEYGGVAMIGYVSAKYGKLGGKKLA